MRVCPEAESRFPTLEPKWSKMVLEDVGVVQQFSILTLEAEGCAGPQSCCTSGLHRPLVGLTAEHWENFVQA